MFKNKYVKNFNKKILKKFLVFFSTVFFKKKKIIKSFETFKLILNLKEYTAWSYYFRNNEKKEVDFIKSKFVDGCNAIDVGANLGFYTLLFSSISPKGKIYAFEPSNENYQKLVENINLNNCNNVFINKLALSDYSGSSNLFLTKDINEGGYYLLKQNNSQNQFLEKIEVKKGDEIIDKNIFYDFVKIDVEGHEIQVLNGMRKILENNVKYLIIETYNQFEAINSYLKKFNFDLVFNTKINSIFIKHHKKLS